MSPLGTLSHSHSRHRSQLPDQRGNGYYNSRTFCRIGKAACSGGRIPTTELDRAVLERVAVAGLGNVLRLLKGNVSMTPAGDTGALTSARRTRDRCRHGPEAHRRRTPRPALGRAAPRRDRRAPRPRRPADQRVRKTPSRSPRPREVAAILRRAILPRVKQSRAALRFSPPEIVLENGPIWAPRTAKQRTRHVRAPSPTGRHARRSATCRAAGAEKPLSRTPDLRRPA